MTTPDSWSRTRPPRPAVLLITGRGIGALLLLVMGAIHLLLWVYDGYRGIPLIGPLFLLNAIGAVLLAIAVVAVPARQLAVVAALGALFTAGTLAGLVVSLTVGLPTGTFTYRERLNGPRVPTTLVVESIGILVLGALAVAARPRT